MRTLKDLPDTPLDVALFRRPEESALKGASPEELVRAAERFTTLWAKFSEPNFALGNEQSITVLSWESGQTDELSGTRLFWRLFRVVGVYATFASCGVLKTIDLDRHARVIDAVRARSDTDGSVSGDVLANLRRLQAEAVRALTHVSLASLAMLATVVAADVDDLEAPSDPVVEALDGLEKLASRVTQTTGDVARCLADINHIVVSAVLDRVADRATSRAEGHTRGAYSSLRLAGLAAMSRRATAATNRYGSKGLESAFEEQLRLIMQSLGFIVVMARPGERAADLLCIATSATPPYSFLVDGKTSSRRYVLPAKDERALADYIAQLGAQVLPLPPIAFALLVGNGPAPSANAKMQALSTRTAVPVRFMDASDLARLRESLVGGVDQDVFRAQLSAGGTTISARVIEILLEADEVPRSAYRHVVDSATRLRALAAAADRAQAQVEPDG